MVHHFHFPHPLQDRLYHLRAAFDLTFFFIVIVIIIQNLIFGVIIDTFAALRAEKDHKEEVLKNTCFICGKGSFNILALRVPL